MALADILKEVDSNPKIGLSEERVRNILPVAKKYISFWRDYPDIFIDFMCGKNSFTKQKGKEEETNFSLFFYQRVFLRAAMRHKYLYAVFPRAYSKSFLTVMVLMIRCILYPGAKLFVTSGGKEQAAGIVKEKVDEICELIPAFKKEIVFESERGKEKSSFTKDYVKVIFKNKSFFDNIAARETSRGKRRHGGVIEEATSVDGDILSEVILPIMNISRRNLDGTITPNDSLNKSQIYITTAGFKNTFPYDKLIQILVWSIIDPSKAIILGGSWRIPVLMKLIDADFINDLKMDGTFNEFSFQREYESLWSGNSEDAFFNSEVFERNRILNLPEYECSGRASKNAYYILAVDVGRKGCDTVIMVLKVTPQVQNNSLKSLVNIYTLADEHFEDQAIKIKKLFYKYKAKRVILDANGLGIGLVDFMIKSQIDPDTGDIYPDFGIYNDTEKYYSKYRTNDTEDDAMYLIKANAAINSEAHSTAQTQLLSGKIKFLIDERQAKAKLLNQKVGQKMTPEQRADYLFPFTATSILKEEMMNLREENEGFNIILKQSNKKIKKDKFSALEYGLYYIKEEEDNKKKKRKFRVSDMMMMN